MPKRPTGERTSRRIRRGGGRLAGRALLTRLLRLLPPSPRRAGYLEGSGFKYEKCKVVAEIGCNHMGKMEIAKELMRLAKDCGATYAKFQKRCNKELLTEEQYNKPHPVPANAYGATYGAHREFLEFTKEQHMELHKYGKEIGIEWATSVWDVTSAREMIEIPCDFLKVRARARCPVGPAERVALSRSRRRGRRTHSRSRRCRRRATTTSRCSRCCATTSRARCTCPRA